MQRIYIVLLCAFLCAGQAWASPELSSSSVELLKRSRALDLSNHPTWLKLVHYEPSSGLGSGWLSAIHDQTFFVSKDGRHNPRKELEATLLELLSPQTVVADQQVQCRFPARTLWLSDQLGIRAMIDTLADCPAFEKWSLSGDTESLSVVFATGYLGNPASYYGHTLLKFNSRNEGARTQLLDVSVNYGAIVPDGEGAIPYIVKGVIGGYDAGFSHIKYYYHTHNYGEIELRDLWEYRLDLPQKDVDFVVAHAWEVLGKKYTYYFFRRNCAYRMAEILEIVEGVSIIPENPFFTMPQSLVKRLRSSRLDGRKLVKRVIYHPSRQSRLYSRYSSLLPQQQRQVSDWVEAYESGSPASMMPNDYAVLDTLLDYYRFVEKTDEDNADQYAKAYRQVLMQRYRLPPHPSTHSIREPISPDRGRPPTRIAGGVIHSSSKGVGVQLQLRPAYYDHLDSDSAHISNSVLTMGELRLNVWDESVTLESLDFVSIESARSAVTGLPGDRPSAWMLRAGLKRSNLACSNCVTFRAEGAWGKAYSPMKGLDITAMVGIAAQDNRFDSGVLNGVGRVQIVSELTDSINVRMSGTWRVPIDIDETSHFEESVEFRYRLGDRYDLRLEYRADQYADQTVLSIGGYW